MKAWHGCNWHLHLLPTTKWNWGVVLIVNLTYKQVMIARIGDHTNPANKSRQAWSVTWLYPLKKWGSWFYTTSYEHLKYRRIEQ